MACFFSSPRAVELYVTYLDMSRVVLVSSNNGSLLRDELFHTGAASRDVRNQGVKLVEQRNAPSFQQLGE